MPTEILHFELIRPHSSSILLTPRAEDRIMLESYKACGKTWGSKTVSHAMGLLDGNGKTAADVEVRCAYFKNLIGKKKKRKGER